MSLSQVGKLLAFVLPLGVDTFAVAAALGARGVATTQQRRRITTLFVAFEGGMPLFGLLLGAPLGAVIGEAADYLAATVLILLGGWMLFVRDDAEEELELASFTAAHGWALIVLGVSISLDELAVGFTLGLSRLPVAVVILAIVVQTAIATQVGLRLGHRLSERFREAAERLAGLALALLGCYLLAQQLFA